MNQTLLTITDRVADYLRQQIELFGDELAIDKKYIVDFATGMASQADTLEDFYVKIKDCQKCSLGKTRQHFVFGEGLESAVIMLIGEAPGADEDRLGRPFVGAAGQLLDKILKAINLDRSQVYITNILKCRPPNNREPLPGETEKCLPYLIHQIELIRPELILALGRIAAQTLLNKTDPISKLRGQVFHGYGARLIPTYHPAALLRDPRLKSLTWEDVQLLRRLYDEIVTKNNE